jgi:hypothetical protein
LKFHCLFFLFWFAPGRLTLGNARLKKGKKAPGEKLPVLIPNPDLFWMLPGRVLKKSRLLVETIRRKREPLIQVPQTQLTFHPLAYRNAFRFTGSRWNAN